MSEINQGKVIQVMGAVVDVKFEDSLPAILEALEIETDGYIHPKDALTEAAKILIHHFMLFSNERISIQDEYAASIEEYDEQSLHMRQLLKMIHLTIVNILFILMGTSHISKLPLEEKKYI